MNLSPRSGAAVTANRPSDLVWIRIPRAALRVSTMLGVAMADGGYLRAWPIAAWAAPAGAALLGFLLGVLHPGELYTYSLLVMALLGAVSGLGAGLGFWALVSFSVGDFFLSTRGSFSRLALSLSLDGVRSAAALLISYVLLAGLLVLIPLLSVAVRAAVLSRTRTRSAEVLGGSALVITQCLLAFLWTQSTPFLIRPVWSYFAGTPEVIAIEPLQQRGWIVVIVIGLAAGARLWLEHRASSVIDPLGLPGLAGSGRRPPPWWLSVTGRTLFVTFMLSGLFMEWFEALITAVALFGIFVLQIRVLPGTRLAAVAERVPLLVRVGLAALLAYIAGVVIVERAAESGVGSFVPLVLATLVSLLIAAVLIPDRQPRAPVRREASAR